MRSPSMLLLVAVILPVAGCQAILGLEETEQTVGLPVDASIDQESGAGAGGSAGDASKEVGLGGAGGDAAVGVDADADPDSTGGDAGAIGAIGQPCTKPNELACAGNFQKLVLYCDPTTMKWGALQSCSGNQICDTTPGPNQGSCQDPVAICIGHQPGDALCDGKKQVICGPDLVTSTEVDCPVVCLHGSCVGTCTPGAVQCNGITPQTCAADGAWQDGAPCAYVCDAGVCTGTCAPGSKQCAMLVPQTCDAKGQWKDGAPCATSCTAGECTGACTAGTKQCNGSMLQTCDSNGTWQDDTACPYVCTSGACAGVCSPSSQQCNGLVPQMCDANGQWQNGVACPFLCAAGACGGECAPGAKQCNGLVPRDCDASGHWQNGAACTYVCAAGGCTGVCTPGATQCKDKIPQNCNASGQWVDGTACQFVCTAGTCSGGCTPGTKQCNGTTPQTCDADGAWQSGNACPFACSNGSCTGVCVPGAKDCNGLIPRTCDAAGQWQSGNACPYLCSSGSCAGVCTPTSKRCNGNTPETCSSSGQWTPGTACSGATPVCQNAACIAQPSCSGLAATCGAGGNASCCSAVAVVGGTFNRSNSSAFPATVSDFKLDVYEITVGRFRKFLQAGYGIESKAPFADTGANPNLAGSGWKTAWNADLESSSANLAAALSCDATYATWTASAGPNENRPINCITWLEAFAFCIWDGGRLATEAEWNYAAAGGSEQRIYPWSVPPSSTTVDATYASYKDGASCNGDGQAACAMTDFLLVGTKAPGLGRWGHADLGGNAYEWTFDYYASQYVNPCVNCANLTTSPDRVMRGGSALFPTTDMRANHREYGDPLSRFNDVGSRCARSL